MTHDPERVVVVTVNGREDSPVFLGFGIAAALVASWFTYDFIVGARVMEGDLPVKPLHLLTAWTVTLLPFAGWVWLSISTELRISEAEIRICWQLWGRELRNESIPTTSVTELRRVLRKGDEGRDYWCVDIVSDSEPCPIRAVRQQELDIVNEAMIELQRALGVEVIDVQE